MLYTTSGTFALGPDVEDQFGDISEKIKQAITGLELPDQVHWFKIVYGQNEGKVITVAATLNNDEHKLLTNKISNLNWPVEDSFYLAKQFVILRPAKDE